MVLSIRADDLLLGVAVPWRHAQPPQTGLSPDMANRSAMMSPVHGPWVAIGDRFNNLPCSASLGLSRIFCSTTVPLKEALEHRKRATELAGRAAVGVSCLVHTHEEILKRTKTIKLSWVKHCCCSEGRRPEPDDKVFTTNARSIE